MRGAGLQGSSARRALRSLPRACAHAASPTRLRARPRPHDALRRGPRFRVRGRSPSREGAAARRRPPRAEPLLLPRPLLPRRGAAAEGAVHGEVAALQAAAAVRLHARRACSRSGAATATRRRSSRRCSILERGGCVAMYPRGGALADRPLGDAAKPGIGRLALESGAPVVPVAIHGSSRVRNWRARPVPDGHRPVRRPDPLRAVVETPRASSSRRWPTRSSREVRGALRRPRAARPPRRHAAASAPARGRAPRRQARRSGASRARGAGSRCSRSRRAARRGGPARAGRRLHTPGLRHRRRPATRRACSSSSRAGRARRPRRRAAAGVPRPRRRRDDGRRRSGLLSMVFAADYATSGRSSLLHGGDDGSLRVGSRSAAATRRTPTAAPQRVRTLRSPPPAGQPQRRPAAVGPDGTLYIGHRRRRRRQRPVRQRPEPRARDETGASAAHAARQAPAHRPEPGGQLHRPVRQPVPRTGPRGLAMGLRNPYRFAFDRATGDRHRGRGAGQGRGGRPRPRRASAG